MASRKPVRRATTRTGLAYRLNGTMFEEAIELRHRRHLLVANRDCNGNDMYVQGMAFALDGLGGPGCTPGGSDPATSTPGIGPCEYYNPFSNAIERSA